MSVPYSWPSVVLIVFKYKLDLTINNQTKAYFLESFCGGTLIDEDTVVTAGHCFVTEYQFMTENQSFYNGLIQPNSYYPTMASMYTIYFGIHNDTEALFGSNSSLSQYKESVNKIILVINFLFFFIWFKS